MSVRSFVGPAGSGKTTRLMDALEARMKDRPLADGQRVLAITRMHGARHRLEERLGQGVARGLCDCMTMDRLAWMLVTRWHDRLAEIGEASPTELDFDETCRVAAVLLRDRSVVTWLARCYPILVVDEFQDCRDGRLWIVQALTTSCDVLLAADEFQDLSGEAGVPAVEWLQTVGNRVNLDHNHRTNDRELLAAADALRTGQKLKSHWGAGFSLVVAQNSNVGASYVARAIRWCSGQSLVILSPTGPTTARFVRDILARLEKKPFEEKPKKKGEKSRTFGPYRVPWERSADAADAALRDALKLPEDPEQQVLPLKFPTGERLPGMYELEQWFEHCRRIKGKTSFSVTEVRLAIGRAVQYHRAHARPSRRIRAMTIQQAKNQDFDQVVVIWPFEVQGDPERLRRLLYNAVTRAKRKAVVIVQDFKNERLTRPPFA